MQNSRAPYKLAREFFDFTPLSHIRSLRCELAYYEFLDKMLQFKNLCGIILGNKILGEVFMTLFLTNDLNMANWWWREA